MSVPTHDTFDHTMLTEHGVVSYDLSEKEPGRISTFVMVLALVSILPVSYVPMNFDLKITLIVLLFTTFLMMLLRSIYAKLNQGKAIVLDFESRSIEIRMFRYPLSFFDMRLKKSVLLDFDNIQSVSRQRTGWGFERIVVYTLDSKFSHTGIEENVEELGARLLSIAKNGSRVPIVRGGLVLGTSAGLIGLLSVFFIGWLLGWI